MLRTLSFTETIAGATYTASCSVPAGYRLIDLIIETTTAWTAATAPVDIGDSDGGDSLVQTLDLAPQGGVTAAGGGGTDWGNGLTGADGPYSAGGAGKLYATADTITAVVTPTVPGGPTGISRVTAWLEQSGAPRKTVVT